MRHFEPLEFHCLDGFSLDGTANPVLLTGSGICDAVGVFTIMQGFQMEVVSGEKVCGNIDDSGPNACGDGNCVDKVNGYTCNCDAGHELMLQENDSVCVAKECGTFLSLSLSLEHGSVEPAKMLFGDVGLVTCLPGFTLSGGVKCGADADFVPGGSLPVCSPRSCGVPPEVSGASRSAEEVLFQGNATYTCDRGYVVGGSFS